MISAFDRVISADSHVNEPLDLWARALGDRFGDQTPRGLDSYRGRDGHFFFSGREVLRLGDPEAEAGPGSREAGFMPDRRVRFQEEADVESELLYPTLGLILFRSHPGEVLRAAAGVFNDWLGEFASYDPKRLVGIGMVPMDDVDWAIGELERISKMGFRGAIINTLAPEGCPPYRDSVYDPFWARAEELDIPLTLHSLAGRTPSPFGFHTAEEHEESPRTMLFAFFEIADVLANEFIFGKILDRFPRLKIVCSEFELSWIPHFMWRLDQMQTAFAERMPLPQLDLKASDYLRTRIWQGIIDDPLARETIPHVGVSRILWGSDYPHVRSIGLNAHSAVAQIFEGMPEADQARIVATNAAELYSL